MGEKYMNEACILKVYIQSKVVAGNLLFGGTFFDRPERRFEDSKLCAFHEAEMTK